MDLLFKEGQVLHSNPFRMVFLSKATNEFEIKVAFSVTKKNFKKAVDRNRVKRLMKESYRKQQQLLENELNKSSQIFFLYTLKEIISYNEMESKMKEALLKLKNKIILE